MLMQKQADKSVTNRSQLGYILANANHESKKDSYLVVIISALLLFGCLELKKDMKSLFLELIKKQSEIKSYEMFANYSIPSLNSRGIMKKLVKENNARADIKVIGALSDVESNASFYEIAGKRYVCPTSSNFAGLWSFIYPQDPSKIKSLCEEEVADPGKHDALSLFFGRKFNEKIATELIDRGMMQLPQNTTETTIANRSCYLFENIRLQNLSALYLRNQSLEMRNFIADFSGKPRDLIILTTCLDKESGVALQSIVSFNTTMLLPIIIIDGNEMIEINRTEESSLTDVIEVNKISLNIDISDSVFQLPAPVVKRCPGLPESLVNQCYYDSVKGNASLCNDYFIGGLDFSRGCIEAVYNITSSKDVCDVLIDDLNRWFCYEWLAEKLNDTSYCAKSNYTFKSAYCTQN